MAEMQKFFYRLSGFTAMQAVLLAGFMTPYILNHKLAVEDGFMAGTIDKHRLLQQAASPRLIFIGGSAFAFGNNSGYIAQQLKSQQYQPINMGLHAGLGMQYMLNEVEPDLKSGDLVVVSMEYENFIDSPPGPKDVADVLEARWQNAGYVPPNYLPALLDKGLVFAGGILRRSLQSATGEIDRQSYYRRSSFNQYGDAVVHYSLPSLTEKVEGDNKIFEFNSDKLQQSIQYLNEFHEVAKTKGARVVFVYPPLMSRLLEKNKTQVQILEADLKQSLTVPILDRPEDVGYPDSYYFDTRYHLNKTGVDARSQHIAQALKQYLQSKSGENAAN